MVLITKV